jgi:hypothetical protein
MCGSADSASSPPLRLSHPPAEGGIDRAALTFWYLGSPYTKYPLGLEAAYQAALTARGLLVRAGIPSFSPIASTHNVAVACGIDPLDWHLWMADDRPFVDAASGLIVLMISGWEESTGLTEERRLFAEAGKPIVFMQPGIVPEEARRVA